MNRTIKIISALIIVVIITTAMSTVFANDTKKSGLSPNSITAGDGADMDKLKTTAGKVLGTIRNVAAIAAVIIIAIFGIKFMIGSTEERAEYKKSFIPLIVGIVVVLGASWIAQLIWGMAGG